MVVILNDRAMNVVLLAALAIFVLVVAFDGLSYKAADLATDPLEIYIWYRFAVAAFCGLPNACPTPSEDQKRDAP